MATVVMSRVIGNELRPREIAGAKVKILARILATEAKQSNPLDCFWVVNRVYDKEIYAEYIRLLKEYNQKYEVLTWRSGEYAKLTSFQQKVSYGTNVNTARNHGIRYCQKTHDFVIAADGDCYIPEKFNVTEQINKDQLSSPERQYYSIPGARLHYTDEECSNPHLEEHVLILRKDADQLFDEKILFAQGENREVFERIGYLTKAGTCILQNTKSRVLQGHIFTLSWSDNKIAENNLASRMDLRQQSIISLVNEMDKVQTTVALL